MIYSCIYFVFEIYIYFNFQIMLMLSISQKISWKIRKINTDCQNMMPGNRIYLTVIFDLMYYMKKCIIFPYSVFYKNNLFLQTVSSERRMILMWIEFDTVLKALVGFILSLLLNLLHRYHLKDVIVGKIYFLLVRIKIKHMEIQIIKRESTGTGIFVSITEHTY